MRVRPPPPAALSLSTAMPGVGDTAWMAGFPLRSARAPGALAAVGYGDADGTLRISRGTVTAVDAPDYFSTDNDGSMGSSGSALFDAAGQVVGLFSRAVGDGPGNAFEYARLERVNVSAGLATRGLGIATGR